MKKWFQLLLSVTVDVWESFLAEDIFIHLGSDQTSLHNPWSGGYYPVDISYEESNRLIRERRYEKVQATLNATPMLLTSTRQKVLTSLIMVMRSC